MNSLINQAMQEIPSKNIVVFVSARDKGKVKLKPLKGKKVKVKASNKVKTGAIVQSADCKIKVDCTFSALLEEKKGELKKELLQELQELR